MTGQSLDTGAMATSERAELYELLFSDGAFEHLAKIDGSELSTHARKKKKQEKLQAQVGLASNALGIAAGAQGLYAANRELTERKGKTPKDPIGRLKPVKAFRNYASKPKNAVRLGMAAVGLQAANLAGDAVANRVLAREAKKQDERVKKDQSLDPRKRYVFDRKSDGMPLGSLTLVNSAAKHGPKAAQGVETATKKTKETAVKVKGGICKRLVPADFEFDLPAEISKVDTDKRQVFGWASIVEKDGQPVVDLQGDYISVEEIEKAAYSYVQKSRKGGNMHQRQGEEPLHVSDMIESFVVTPEKKEKLGLPDSMPTGWWVGYQVHDDTTWSDIKAGKLTAFSIHGKGKRTPL